jgi:hypothetical protein
MLKELLNNDTLFFIAVHAFLIGLTLGITVCYKSINALKSKLKSQVKAYEDLLQSSSVEFPVNRNQEKKKPIHLIPVKEDYARQTGMAV